MVYTTTNKKSFFYTPFFGRPSNKIKNKNKNKIQGKTFLLVALLGD